MRRVKIHTEPQTYFRPTGNPRQPTSLRYPQSSKYPAALWVNVRAERDGGLNGLEIKKLGEKAVRIEIGNRATLLLRDFLNEAFPVGVEVKGRFSDDEAA